MPATSRVPPFRVRTPLAANTRPLGRLALLLLAANWYVRLLFPRSLITADRQFVGATSALTHASTVIPVVRSRTAESFTDTRSLAPSKDSAEPYRPLTDHSAPLRVPVPVLPDRSAVVTPTPSSNP